MVYRLCLILLTYITIAYTQPLSAMTEQQQIKAQLECYNTRASLLYEQAFFLELLSAIISTRRYDELNADVALAYSTITSHAESSIKHNELPFNEDIPPHEIFSLSNTYYVCIYLTNQKTFHKLFSKLPFIAENQEVKLLAHTVALLSALVELQKTNKSKCITYLHNITTRLTTIIYEYQMIYRSLRTTYTECIRLLREQALYYEDSTQYIFHRYINPQQKLLPLFLDSNEEPVLYAPITTEHIAPIYEYVQKCSPSQPIKKRKTKKTTPDIPIMQFIHYIPCSLKNYYDMFAAYDYQEYITSHIFHALEKPNELPLFLQDFFSSYHKNRETLEYVFTRMQQDPDSFITYSLIPLYKICNTLHHIQENPSSSLQHLQDLKVILKEHYQMRILS